MLHAAASRDQAAIASYCAERGATITDGIMSTIISSSAMETHIALVTSGSVSVSRFIPWFGTVLGVAAAESNLAWTRFRLDHGADAERERVDEYKSVLGAAAKGGHVAVVDLLMERGVRVGGSRAIVLAAEAGEEDMVRLLLERGADVDEVGVEHPTDERQTAERGSALHKAIAEGHGRIVELLLERGADVNFEGWTGEDTAGISQGEEQGTTGCGIGESRGG